MTDETGNRRTNLRRSTRVPIRVRIEVQATGLSCDGETIVVNMHGALVKTSDPLELGARISVHVQLTGKSADARVVFASRERPLEFGVGLDRPQNIWGISLPPADWREEI
ncbi:MAG TPA: PilZ domain-containing protein [Terriglobales bacterium]|nr:PilZ domain-containing protein [Terriglobales bacterium]